MRLPNLPVVLTIAGSDSGGGAGLQADLKTFAALKTHGVTVVSSITAQNPGRVLAAKACPPSLVQAQLEAVRPFRPGAAKTGMLLARAVILAVADFFKQHRDIPLVVDPVMIATSGARLLQSGASRALSQSLLPLATLVTPNVDEAEALSGATVKEPEDLRRAARLIHARFGCAVLVKGGHLDTGATAIDLFFDGTEELLLEAPRWRGISTHGTGCTYSAAIAAFLARGLPLPLAVSEAKSFITAAIAESVQAGPYAVLNPFSSR